MTAKNAIDDSQGIALYCAPTQMHLLQNNIYLHTRYLIHQSACCPVHLSPVWVWSHSNQKI